MEETSSLTEFAGVNQKKARLLREKGYDTPEKIAKATVEQLVDIDGISRGLADRIVSVAEEEFDVEKAARKPNEEPEEFRLSPITHIPGEERQKVDQQKVVEYNSVLGFPIGNADPKMYLWFVDPYPERKSIADYSLIFFKRGGEISLAANRTQRQQILERDAVLRRIDDEKKYTEIDERPVFIREYKILSQDEVSDISETDYVLPDKLTKTPLPICHLSPDINISKR
jgi:hypothetical protein